MVTTIFWCSCHAIRDFSEANEVKTQQVNMQVIQIFDGCSPLCCAPVLSIRLKFVFGNPNEFQLVDPIAPCCKCKGSLFHFVSRSITALPKGQLVSLCAQVCCDSVGWYFADDKAFIFPFGACDFSSQEQ